MTGGVASVDADTLGAKPATRRANLGRYGAKHLESCRKLEFVKGVTKRRLTQTRQPRTTAFRTTTGCGVRARVTPTGCGGALFAGHNGEIPMDQVAPSGGGLLRAAGPSDARRGERMKTRARTRAQSFPSAQPNEDKMDEQGSWRTMDVG